MSETNTPCHAAVMVDYREVIFPGNDKCNTTDDSLNIVKMLSRNFYRFYQVSLMNVFN